jgi:peptide/nickel transport system ATP-binding protein
MDVAKLVADYTISNKAIVGVVLADERGDARTVLNAPQHPYSRQLRAAVLLPEVVTPAPAATITP